MSERWQLTNTYTIEIYRNRPLAHVTIFDAKGTNLTEFWFDSNIMKLFVEALRKFRAGSAT